MLSLRQHLYLNSLNVTELVTLIKNLAIRHLSKGSSISSVLFSQYCQFLETVFYKMLVIYKEYCI
jgi:hypothetical protein